MKHYKTIWGIIVGIFGCAMLGSLIYGGLSNDKVNSVIETIRKLDTTNVSYISIASSNVDYKINLTVDTLIVKDKKIANSIIKALNNLVEKPAPRGEKLLWESYVSVYFIKSFNVDLKNKNKLDLFVYNTQAGLFVQLLNVMDVQTYSCEELKPILEEIACYKNPVGKDQ